MIEYCGKVYYLKTTITTKFKESEYISNTWIRWYQHDEVGRQGDENARVWIWLRAELGSELS